MADLDTMGRGRRTFPGEIRILIDELNTIPGFTEISIASEGDGCERRSHPELIDRLVAHGLARGSLPRPIEPTNREAL